MVPSQRYCTRCGAANQVQDAFCFACGYPLKVTTTSQQYSIGGSVTTTSTGLLTPNLLLKHRYRIIDTVGKGGFGAVYKVEDVQLGNRLLAVKEMSQNTLNPQEIAEAAEDFKREALLLAALTHPNLPRIYEQFSEAGRWYLVMDFIEGETLEVYLQKQLEGHLSVKETLQIGIQLCTVLAYLHNRQPPIIFRDLKPSNIMLTPEEYLYLIDFGIARHFKPGQKKDTIAFGSPGYAAPEQYGKGQTTPQSDIYSLGATLHHLLSGIDPSLSPFIFAPLSGPTIPAELATLILRMVRTETNQRPSTLAEVKQELQRIAVPLTGSQLLPAINVGGSSLPPAQSTALSYLPELSPAPPVSSIQKRKPSAPASLASLTQIHAPSVPQKTNYEWRSEGNTYFNGKHYQEALAAYEQAIRINPNDALSYCGKGNSLHYLKRYQEALAAYEQAIRINPNRGDNYFGKGVALSFLNRYQEALAAYEQVIRLSPNHHKAYHNKGTALYYLSRYQEALAAYEQAIRLSPNNAGNYYGKSLTLEKLGEKSEARQAHEKAKQLDNRRLSSTPNLSSSRSQLSLTGIIFSIVGITWGTIGCILAILSLFSVNLRLFPAGLANICIGLLIFFLARIRKISLFLSTIGIIVGAIAIVTGVGIMIIAVTFPNVIINEIGGGQGSGSLESGTVMILAGVVILGICVLSKFRR